jgi:hypothetical protein
MAWYPEEEALILERAEMLAWWQSKSDNPGRAGELERLAGWLTEAVAEIRRLRKDAAICPCPHCLGCCCRRPGCVNRDEEVFDGGER